MLLLHGAPQTSAVWTRLAEILSTDRVVLAPDLKGLGASEHRPPYDLATLAAEQAALILHELEGLPGDGRVDVVGHDWGGVIALALAESRGDLVRRLGVLAAPYRRVSLLRAPHLLALRLPVLPEVAFRLAGDRLAATAVRLAAGPGVAASGFVRAPLGGPGAADGLLAYYRQGAPAGLADLVRGRLRVPARGTPGPPHGFRPDVAGAGAAGAGDGGFRASPGPADAVSGGAGAASGAADADAVCRVTRARGPWVPRPGQLQVERALVCWGTADPVLPLALGEGVAEDLTAALPGGRVRMVSVPGAGHWLVEEAPDVVHPLLIDFLRAP